MEGEGHSFGTQATVENNRLSVDFSLCTVSGHRWLFELMLRGGDGYLQSLHQFATSTGGDTYRLPVLLYVVCLSYNGITDKPSGENLSSGQVVELGVQLDRGSKQVTDGCIPVCGIHP